MTFGRKRVRIDFTTPSLARSVYRAGIGTWLLVGAALALSAGAAWLGLELAEQQQRYDAEIAQVRAAHQTPPPVRPGNPSPPRCPHRW